MVALVPKAETFIAWAESFDSMTYYRVLRVARDASADQIKDAFQQLALRCHPDQYVEEEEDVRVAAAQVFKRTVEAYGILSKPELRAKYDKLVLMGQLRMTPEERVPEQRKAEKPSFESMAQTEDAKKHARKADRLVLTGNLEAARIALIDASRLEPFNEALKTSLRALYT
jgi:curved DNA-binding protein CbpA